MAVSYTTGASYLARGQARKSTGVPHSTISRTYRIEIRGPLRISPRKIEIQDLLAAIRRVRFLRTRTCSDLQLERGVMQKLRSAKP